MERSATSANMVLHSIQDILSHVPNLYTKYSSKRRRRSSTPSSDAAMDSKGHSTVSMSSTDSGIATPEMFSPVLTTADSGMATPPMGSPVITEEYQRLHCDKYQLVRAIQKGSTATVYLGQNPVTGELAAIKHIQVTDSNRKLVLREIEMQAYCDNHPNVACVYDAMDNGDGTLSIAMEWVPNGDLIDLVSATGGLPIADVLRYGSEIAQTLSWMHSHGVAHRDLKCENVCIAADGSARIIDFGQAHFMDKVPRTRQAGTKNYMSPQCWESVSGEMYDMAAADAWSFGVLIYCLLTARFPWAQATMDNYDFQLFASGSMSKQLATHWQNIPPSMRILLEHTLVIDPSQRWNIATVCAYLSMIANAVEVQQH